MSQSTTKPTKRYMCLAKTQISLSIPPSMIRFCALRSMIAKDLRLLHAGSEDAGQTERLPRLTGCISFARTCIICPG